MISQEEWRPVKDFPNTQVSNFGRVRSLFRGQQKIRRTRINANGYEVLGLQRGEHKVSKKVHILVAEAFIGIRPKGADVNHIDGAKTNNYADNLEYISRSENLKHAFRLGLATTPFGKRGEASLQSLLTDEIVLDIRERHANGTKRSEIAAKYGISYYTVWDITTRRSWTHI